MNNQVNYFVNPMHLFQKDADSKTELAQQTRSDNKQHLVTGFRKEWIELLFRFTIIKIAVKNYSNPWHWLAVPLALDKKRRKNIGEHRLYKLANVGKTYYWSLYTPGWSRNSASFKSFIASEMNRIVPIKGKTNRFTSAYVAITKKCSLQCEHCYEWDNLNQKETQSEDKIHQTIARLQEKGISQIHLSGGEPLLKVNLIADIVRKAQKGTDFWVLTSGFKLHNENAEKIKAAGVKGVMISLDHYLHEKHNMFRGFKDAYYWVETAVHNAIENDLTTALSICVTRDFVTQNNLMQYALLAKKMGVSFIQILEPRAVGHYKEKEVDLTEEQIQLLEKFYLEMNYSPKYKDFPLISYHGYYQRRMGCYGAGNRSLYVDSDGDLNACPFCQKKSGNILNDDFPTVLEELQTNGCQQFKGSTD
ncbi:hypothetical protein FSS13T_21560 [Flavobacterium saliperosum S13]|uniref:Radical SAM superfamily enzyme, MoaA/NifB/PqqE/SkfB family n=2 Tax=Flavobacterium saliperosum TaxID=329186 RepID=A0A1G4VQL2_9FLAO|nr:radical SAM protein [Flavobacterium saliperosum]ESU23851.1 hypothetical protein FSS13T_21560 [Flavobacterium saliperosum S13]SCX10319.1 Radical SAM superfamily enzyme, MoaA/NifB/PqqE/SkfB family [Flavobacterium saliperosum]